MFPISFRAAGTLWQAFLYMHAARQFLFMPVAQNVR
jgi:hypothetical protein